jgi:hypothetical protein
MVDSAQDLANCLEEYICKLQPGGHDMSPAILAAALVLSRLHGAPFAAFFLLDLGIAFEVIAELLWDEPEAPTYRYNNVGT